MKPAATTTRHSTGEASAAGLPRRFEFDRDRFAFANELVWEYRFDADSGRTTFVPRKPKPDYSHRCFVLTCAATQFFFHAAFHPAMARTGDAEYRRLVRAVLSKSPRVPSPPNQRICFPGYDCLRQFSGDHEQLLKSECGGAWRSYVLRSHWRMVFPISRAHQARTAAQLMETLQTKGSAVVHLVRFPKLTINHGMVVYGAREREDGFDFDAYDPNDPHKPAQLSFNPATRTFRLPANAYWVGGDLDVIEIYRSWWL